MMKELIAKSELLLARCETVTLASVSEEGFPRICVMSPNRREGVRRVYLSTGTDSVKTKHFRKNSRASLCFTEGNDSVTLLGHVTVLEDAAIKQELWEDWYISHFPGGPEDPGYCILRFDAFEATIWIDRIFKTVTIEE